MLRKSRISLHALYVLSFVCILIAGFLVYFFSFDSRVHILACENNYYLTDFQVYELAGVSTNTRLWLMPSSLIRSRLESNDLIESASVKKTEDKLLISIKEKVILGYYVKDDKNYMLTSSGDSIEIQTDDLEMIIHFPLLNGFSDQQLEMIVDAFQQNKKLLDRSILEKVAEMVPYSSSYDENMIKMTMQDGNIVYSAMSSLSMLSNYQAMLTQLKGESVCLFLDAEYSAIDKVDCQEFTRTNDEEKEVDQQEQQPVEEQPEQEQTPDTAASMYDAVQDWQESEYFGLVYSPSQNVYKDPNTNAYYRFNETSLSFEPLS